MKTCPNELLLSTAKRNLVFTKFRNIQNFIYHDNSGGELNGWPAFGPIAELMIRKQGYSLDEVRQGVVWMQKTFAVLLAYSPNNEQIDLTFTPTADACFHAFLQINPLWKQFEHYIDREIYHFPFISGKPLENIRNTTSELFIYHFSENPFEKDNATSCSSCCLSPNPPLPVPVDW